MNAREWAGRLASLVRKVDTKTAGARFRNDYRDAVAAGLASGALSRPAADLLLEARAIIERWISKTRPQASEALTQWTTFYNNAGRGGVPELVLRALIGRLPRLRYQRAEVATLVLGTSEERLLQDLMARRIVTPRDLAALVKEHAAEFYQSPALDAALHRGLACPRGVWARYESGESRPPDLMPPSDALVLSFTLDRKPDAGRWLIALLTRAPGLREELLASLLATPAAAPRFVWELAAEYRKSRGRRPRGSDPAFESIMEQCLELSIAGISRAGGPERSAALVLSLLRLLSALGIPDRTDASLVRSLARAPAAAEKAVSSMLRAAEGAGARTQEEVLLAVTGAELYRGVHRFWQQLPGLAGEPEGQSERSLRLERFAGRREVITGLLSALDSTAGPSLRDSVEAVLFNYGVREFGEIGERVTFDPRLHQTSEAGLIPGDAATVTRPGRSIGSPTGGLILALASVVGAPAPEGDAQ